MTKKILKVILGEEVYLNVELDLANGGSTPSPIPPPLPPPIPPLPPSGPGDGSRNNPYKLDTQDKRGLGLTSVLWPDCGVSIPMNTKVYFELDPTLSQGVHTGEDDRNWICMMNVKGFNNQYLNCYFLIVDRVTGNEIVPETQIGQNYGMSLNIWNRSPHTFNKVKYIFAVENVGPEAGIQVFMSW